jgi:hypothetical protein
MCLNVDNGACIPELIWFQDHFSQYKIVVYVGLDCNSIMFEGQVEASERLNLLYDDVTRHYLVIGTVTDAMAKRYVCKACGKGCSRDITHTCDRSCSDCMTSIPCVSAGVPIPYADYNRHFRSQNCFDNHMRRSGSEKGICERRRNFGSCGEPVIQNIKHECGKKFVGRAKRTER